ncbi:unnamed protein product [Heligmosomoides polygyrus]|uniref:HTH_48 domain-containing protein n=1 Tax=Heligmosomoides polygyrus TaxID=6339 RepID=A0A183GRA9_HELPZ|nr:unnamed protein product [Heligmosomoides polygyrus]
METKMLRWTAGVTRMDSIRNDAIRQKFGVAPIPDKMREARLRWYGQVLRAKEDNVRKIGLELDVSGKRPRGRTKQRWSDTRPTALAPLVMVCVWRECKGVIQYELLRRSAILSVRQNRREAFEALSESCTRTLAHTLQ